MKVLETFAEKTTTGFHVKSPSVGYASHLPQAGEIVTPAKAVGNLKILGTTYTLTLPKDVTGQVDQVEMELLLKPVAYEEILFTLTPVDAGDTIVGSQLAAPKVTTAQGNFLISAPTDGIFYRRPSPDTPPYVEVGTVVKTGQVLGLVEVMKCFNQITFTGSYLPPQATIVEVYVADGAEVKYQQPLFLLA